MKSKADDLYLDNLKPVPQDLKKNDIVNKDVLNNIITDIIINILLVINLINFQVKYLRKD